MGLRDNIAASFRRMADALGKPAFAGTPFPTGQPERQEQLFDESGGTGTFLFGGFIRGEDPLAAMDGLTAIQNLDEMRRSDAQVHASLEVIKQPIRTAGYEVDASDPDDPESEEIAEFVRWVLFDRMTTTWDDVIRQALLMLDFGVMLFEKVWAVEEDGMYEGRIVLRKLAPRPPKTLWQWFTDEDGALLSIKQLAVKAGTYQFLDVPASKLVRFTFQQEGDNFMGISMLRSAYPHYAIKRQLYNIDAIRATRFGVGIPRAKFAAGFHPTREDRQAMSQMLQGLSSHPHAYLMEPPQFTVDILMPSGGSQQTEVLPSIEHHNAQITRNILAQFLDMGGKSSGGSRALGASAMDFFLNAIESIANGLCDTLNKQVIKPLVDFNYDTQKYPTLRAAGIQESDVKSLAAAIASLATAGFMTPDKKTENTLRGLLNLPEIADAEEQIGVDEDPDGGADGSVPSDAGASGVAPPAQAATTQAPAAAVAVSQKPAGVAVVNAAAQPRAVEESEAQPQPPERAVDENLLAPSVDGRPAVIEPAQHQPATSHDPRGQAEPARSTYGGGAADDVARTAGQDGAQAIGAPEAVLTPYARTDATGTLPARSTAATSEPAVPAQRAPGYATSTETRTLPARTDALPSGPERPAHMARSTVPASSGDADEEGHSTSRSAASSVAVSSRLQPPHAAASTSLSEETSSTRIPSPSVALAARGTRSPWTDGQVTFWRRPTTLEETCLDLREMPSRLATARTALLATLRGVRGEQILRLASAVAHAGSKDVMTLKPPLVGKMASDILKAMRPVYEYGQEQVRSELARQAGHAVAAREIALASPKTSAQAIPHLVSSAQISAQTASDRLLGLARQESLRLSRAGWDPDEIEDALLIHLGELSDADVSRIANQEVNEAFSLGRVAAADELKDQIELATYSAILDDRCCPPCEANDGTEVQVDSDLYDELMPPFSGCEGQDQCRCLYIFTLASPDEGAEA